MAMFIYGFSKLPEKPGWMLMTGGAAAGLLFYYAEKKTDTPVFDFRLFIRNRVFALSSVAALLHYAATAATGFFMSLYLQLVHHLDSRAAGLIMISQPLAMMILSPLAGRLSDKINPGIVASSGMALTASGIFSLCFISLGTPVAIIVLLLSIMGTGFAFFSSPNSNAVMSSVGKKHFGIASGVVGTMRVIGQSLSMGLAMMILTLYTGKQTVSEVHPDAFLKGMRTAFFIFSLLCILGIIASLARNNVKTNPEA